MRNLIAFPVIVLAVILQSAVISRMPLLSGFGDLPMVMLITWTLQQEVDSAWHWAIATGIMVGIVSALPWPVYVVGYALVVAVAKFLQRRIWQAPLLVLFSVTFLGTLILYGLSLAVLRFIGASVSFQDTFGLLILPGTLLNLLLAIPLYAVMRDLARWVYPSLEVE
jgi:rod shape-determining protein MreD